MPSTYLGDDDEDQLDYFKEDDPNSPNAPPPVIPPGTPPSMPGGLPPVAPGGNGGPTPIAPAQAPMPAVDPTALNAARARLQQVQGAPPQIEKPKWWQRVLAGAEGGAAGYVNASGHRGVQVDPSAAIHNTLFPGLDMKQAQYQQQVNAATGNVAQEQAKYDTGLKTVEETAKAKKALADADEQTARAGSYRSTAAALDREGRLKPVTVPGGGLWDPNSKSWLRQPTDKTQLIKVKPELGDKLGLAPDQNGEFYIPTGAAGTLIRAQDATPKLDETAIAIKAAGVNPDSTKWSAGDAAKVQAELARQRQAGMKVTVNAGGMSGNDPKDIADAIINGDQPPDLKGLYRMGAPVRGELARRGYDLVGAQRDWQGVQRHIATLNGPQQERLRQAISFTHDSIPMIRNLYQQWQQTGLPGGFKIWNRAALEAATHLPGDAGSIATNLKSQINDLTSELGNVYMGGNSPTEESLKLAGNNLNGEWNDNTFRDALKRLETNLTIRANSIKNSMPAGVNPNSPYVGGSGNTGGNAGSGVPVSEKALRAHGKQLGMTDAQINNEVQQAKKQPGVQWVP